MRKPNDIACFFTFFHNMRHNLAHILTQDHTQFDFFAGFQWSILGDLINIKNFNWNPVVLKKFAKTYKNYYFSAQLVQKWGPHGPCPKEETFFFEK